MLTFAELLRAAREARGYSPYRLAQLTGLSLQGVINLQLPDADPKLSTVLRLARALDLDPRDLVPGGGRPGSTRVEQGGGGRAAADPCEAAPAPPGAEPPSTGDARPGAETLQSLLLATLEKAGKRLSTAQVVAVMGHRIPPHKANFAWFSNRHSQKKKGRPGPAYDGSSGDDTTDYRDRVTEIVWTGKMMIVSKALGVLKRGGFVDSVRDGASVVYGRTNKPYRGKSPSSRSMPLATAPLHDPHRTRRT